MNICIKSSVEKTIEMSAEQKFNVGDIISFVLTDGEEVEAMAVVEESDGMVFVLVDCLQKEYQMNSRNTNENGYEKCNLRAKLSDEILDRFPAEIREKMTAFENGDFLRLPTEMEIFGENVYGTKDDAKQWEPMKLRRNRIAFRGKNGGWEWYWLQNKRKDSAASFALVSSGGEAHYFNASIAFGVRPAFKI